MKKYNDLISFFLYILFSKFPMFLFFFIFLILVLLVYKILFHTASNNFLFVCYYAFLY